VPDPLASLVQRMMAKEPRARFSTPAEVAQALAPFAAAADLAKLWQESPPMHALPPLRARAAAWHGGPWGVVCAAVLVCGLAFWGASHFLIARRSPTPDQNTTKGQTNGKVVPVADASDTKPRPRVRRKSAPPPDMRKARERQDTWAANLGIPKEQTNSIGMKLVLVPSGAFTMGTDRDDLRGINDTSNESPPHQVTILQPFLLGAYEVTQAEYQQVMGSNPSSAPARKSGASDSSVADRGRNPVDTVSWANAVEFCRRLAVSEHTARRVYRLPTEAEWEYACRAGAATRWYCGDDEDDVEDIAWGRANSDDTTHPVGQKSPNAWGLYDMLGNAHEWCQDWYAPDYYQQSPDEDPIGPSKGLERVIRGGSYYNPPALCRCASRAGAPVDGSHVIGFRVLCELPAVAKPAASPATKPASAPPISQPAKAAP
jgi:formylglycine-generating enzyme required for sulfatase activity